MNHVSSAQTLKKERETETVYWKKGVVTYTECCHFRLDAVSYTDFWKR